MFKFKRREAVEIDSTIHLYKDIKLIKELIIAKN